MSSLPRFLLLPCLFACALPATADTPALASAPSSFVRGLASSPVRWRTWGPAVADEAKRAEKPVYLLIGSASNELSLAMVRQSFSNPQVAERINESFIPVAVDRDEQADLAILYQSYVSTKKQLTGWPLNLWLTPDLKPLEGATYLPPSEEWGKEGFINVVQRVTASWANDREGQLQKAEEAVTDTIAADYAPDAQRLSADALRDKLAAATETWLERYDATHGGFGETPKFPEPELLRFLLTREGAARDAALATLRTLATSRMRDPLDGGFYRYATDVSWRMPYLQKHTSDQARLALAYLDAAVLTQDQAFADTARRLLQFAIAHLRRADGGFASSLDSTPEDIRLGSLWTEAELVDTLGAAEAAVFAAAHGATKDGNIAAEDDPSGKLRGRNILGSPAAGSSDLKRLEAARAKLLQVRSKRAPARRDDNAVSATQGWMLQALAQGGAVLAEPRFLDAARENLAFIRKALLRDDARRLLRLAGSESAAVPADHAALAGGLLAAAAALGDKQAAAEAKQLLQSVAASALNRSSGRFAVGSTDTFGLWHRPYTLPPAAGEAPSAESLALLAVLASPETGLAAADRELLAGGLTAELDESVWPPHGGALLAADALARQSP